MKPLLSAQYLRALASIGVVAFHTGRATILGQAGVDVFFVISGFIMWMVTIKPIGPGQFLWHRVVRVVPLYWIATLIMAAVRGSSAPDAIESLLFWPHRDAGGQVWPVLVQGWTLNFEMFFYLVFAGDTADPAAPPIVVPHAGAVQPQRDRTCVATAWRGAAYLYQPAVPGISRWRLAVGDRPAQRFPGFKLAVAMLIVGLLGFAISLRKPAPDLWRFIVWGVPSLLVVCGAISIELRRGLPTIGPLKLLGDGSYSIYLFHTFVFYAVFYAAKSPIGRMAGSCSGGCRHRHHCRHRNWRCRLLPDRTATHGAAEAPGQTRHRHTNFTGMTVMRDRAWDS